MSPRTTLLLAVAVAALGAFVWFWEVEGAADRAAAEQTAKEVFPDLTPEALTALVVRSDEGDEVRLERDGGWRLRAPVDAPADPMTADALAAAVADLATESTFDDPEPRESYGLTGEPRVRAEAGERHVALWLGDATPTGTNTYVAAEGDERVFTVATYRTNALRKSLGDLRDARILSFDREAVTDVEVTWKGGGVAVAKGEEAWRVRKPLDAAADEGTISGLLSDLSYLRAEDYVDEPAAEQRTALGSPAYQVTLRGAEDAVLAELRIAFAGGDEGEGTRRLVQGREGFLYEIAEGRLDDLPRTVTAFRFKELSSFPVNDAARFELAFQGEGEELLVQAEQTAEGSWTSTPEPLAPGKASRLLSELSSLEAADIAAESMGPDELAGIGLAPPRVTVRVLPEEGDTALAKLHLGRLEPGRGIAAQRPDDPIVYWLPEALAEHLPVSLEAWRNRFLAEEAETDEAPEEEEGADEEE